LAITLKWSNRRKEYVRHAQAELILKPILARLLTLLKSEQAIEQRLTHALATVRSTSWEEQGYGGGNVINLLYQLRGTLRGYDFSKLRIRQAYFAGVELQEANFAESRFDQTVFSETFSSIFSVAFSPDGTTLASGGRDGTVSVWEVSSGACLRTLHSHPSRIWAVVFSPDGSTVMSGSEDRTILCWNVRTGECLNMVRNRLYEGMNITGITGLTEAQKATLRELGAVEGEGDTSWKVRNLRPGLRLPRWPFDR
jgi:WD40 repeat protein